MIIILDDTQFSIISLSSDHLTLFYLLQRDQSPLLTCLIFLMAHWVSGCVSIQCMICYIECNNFTHLHTDDSHLRLLMVALTDIAYQWKHLGDQLELEYGKLKAIDQSERGIPIDCMREMLAAWLQDSGGECSKQALITALQNIRCF